MDEVVFPAEILIPRTEDLTKWACIACDQFTSEKHYWEELKSFIGTSVSTLNLIFPEAYLNDNPSERINKIHRCMEDYQNSGVFKKLPKGYILTIRKTPFTEKRVGIVAALDLDKYEYKNGSTYPVRATEDTIEDRIPPRLNIRRGVEIELPHAMVLFDDDKKTVTEKLYEEREKFVKLYDFELNMNGGRLQGYFIPAENETVIKLNSFAGESVSSNKYGIKTPFGFAVGDGNHSLATAKAYWEEIKKGLTEEEKQNHPARFALCELINVYDEGIHFQPIFRFVKGVDVNKFIKGLNENCHGNYAFYAGGIKREVSGREDFSSTIQNIDKFIHDYISENGGSVDYVHGEENLFSLVNKDVSAIGIMPQTLKKEELFKIVAKFGALPKKAFSMGEAVEKRYYMEARLIK